MGFKLPAPVHPTPQSEDLGLAEHLVMTGDVPPERVSAPPRSIDLASRTAIRFMRWMGGIDTTEQSAGNFHDRRP